MVIATICCPNSKSYINPGMSLRDAKFSELLPKIFDKYPGEHIYDRPRLCRPVFYDRSTNLKITDYDRRCAEGMCLSCSLSSLHVLLTSPFVHIFLFSSNWLYCTCFTVPFGFVRSDTFYLNIFFFFRGMLPRGNPCLATEGTNERNRNE